MVIMADMRMVGQGVRRRMGASMSHLGGIEMAQQPQRSAGNWTGYPAVTTNSDSEAQALAGMAKIGNPRMPMGQQAIQLGSVATPMRGKLVQKSGNSKGGNDAGFGVKANKSNGMANEHNGPRFGITVKMPGGFQEKSEVQGNGKIVPSVMGQRPNFDNQVGMYGVWGPS
jgi:hypothetical protein